MKSCKIHNFFVFLHPKAIPVEFLQGKLILKQTTFYDIRMMKLKYLFTAAVLAAPLMLSAKPADPRVRTATNPDGTEVQYRVLGDEHLHFMTDVDRTVILERNEDGYLRVATRNGKPLQFDMSSVDMLREEREAALPPYEGTGATGPMKMATLDVNGRSNYPTIGEGNRSLVVLVEFSDVDFTVENPQEYYTRQLNEPGFSDYWGKGSALDYYIDTSNGKYKPQFDVYGPVKISKKAAYFEDNDSGHMSELIQESLTTLYEAGEIDFTNYDLDENGIVDTVFFYYAGYGQADSDTHTIWPHQYDYQVYVNYFNKPQLKFDGLKIGPYACGNELKGYNPETKRSPWYDNSTPWVDGIGTFVHEYGHVLGLPDLYDVDYSGESDTPDDWTVMASGCYNDNGCVPPLFSAYEQWVCHWLEYEEPTDGTHYDLTALGHTDEPTALKLKVYKGMGIGATEEYFVIETRDNSGWDSCFPEGGILIWHINYTKSTWTSNSVNTGGATNVGIYYGNGKHNPVFTSGVIYPGGAKELKPLKKVTKWECPYITGISYDKENTTGSLDYNVVTSAPTITTVLSDSPYADLGTAKNFTIEWDPVEDADSYLVTIQRISNDKYLGVYNEFDVGNVTKCKVVSVPTAYWNNELRAYVRVVKGLPSSETSNVITFVPNELPRGTNGIVTVNGEEISISGGYGCVEAPEGAQVFDISGRRMENANLPAGIYIVRTQGKSVKVVVK